MLKTDKRNRLLLADARGRAAGAWIELVVAHRTMQPAKSSSKRAAWAAITHAQSIGCTYRPHTGLWVVRTAVNTQRHVMLVGSRSRRDTCSDLTFALPTPA